MPITKKQFFSFAITLPILVPAVSLALFGLDLDVLAFPVVAAVVGGVPYIGFTGLHAWRLRHASDEAIEHAIVRAPLRFIPFQLVFIAACLALILIFGHATSADFPGAALGLIFLLAIAPVLIFGYAYVTITFILMASLQAMGLVERDADPATLPPPTGTLPGRP